MITDLIGRFHPLVVHFPIGFLFIAFIFELMSWFPTWKKLRRAVLPALVMGTIAAALALITGFLFADGMETDSKLLFRHKLFGISTVIAAALLLVIILIGREFSRPLRTQIRLLLFIVTLMALTLTGHFGGELAHGQDYWFGDAAQGQTQAVVSNTRFSNRIRPILERKCYSCHGTQRQKGGLRLDSEEMIVKGGKHGAIIGGDQELLRRIHLDPSDEKHMPPKEKTQLTAEEIEELTNWIDSGASFTEPDSVLNPDAGNSSAKVQSWIPEEEPDGAVSTESIQKLRTTGTRVVQLAFGSNWLEVTVLPVVKLDETFWTAWEELAPFIASARFSRCELSDNHLEKIAAAASLRRLFLDQTSVGDAGISGLRGLKQLSYLNIVSTRVGGEGIKHLQHLPALKDLYVFGCPITKEDLAGWDKTKVRIDTGGVKIPFLPTDTTEFTKK